jgi:prepilin-type N-terminal cleavage/methylation domain-containing protein
VTKRRGERPRGITLLELLIVMVILLMVTAAAIPIVAPAMRNRQMREATRLMSAYFGAARARAVQTGRPVGVRIERFNGSTFALSLSQIEVPPPYSGDSTSSKMKVRSKTPTPSSDTYFQSRFGASGFTAKWFEATDDTGDFTASMVRIGDEIQFNSQGPKLIICGPDTDGNGLIDGSVIELAFMHLGTLHQAFPWDNTAPLPQPATYQIFRQATRSTARPLNLPEGIVVDLVASGIGMSGSFMSPDSFGGFTIVDAPLPPLPPPVVPFDPLIVFSPSGRLEWVTRNADGQLVRATDTVYLLIGRRELTFDVTQKGQPGAELKKDVVAQNLSAVADPVATVLPPPENFWLSIGYQTGQVTVTEIAANVQDYTITPPPPPPPPEPPPPPPRLTVIITNALQNARKFARESQSLGGR